MLATNERVEILDTAEEIAQMIMESEIAEKYFRCLYNLRNSKESQDKVQAFVKVKELYEEVQRFGSHHPDYKRVMKDVRVLKRKMDLDENVAEFKSAENELQSLLDEISVLIGYSVSENIKVPTGDPFFTGSSGCGGCSSGGCS